MWSWYGNIKRYFFLYPNKPVTSTYFPLQYLQYCQISCLISILRTTDLSKLGIYFFGYYFCFITRKYGPWCHTDSVVKYNTTQFNHRPVLYPTSFFDIFWELPNAPQSVVPNCLCILTVVESWHWQMAEMYVSFHIW